MPMLAVHPRVLADLGRALSLELTAVQQYLTQAVLVESWGDSASADRFRRETVEEMHHAERLVARMIRLGVAPGASQLRPAAHASDLAGLLQLNANLEHQLVAHYAEAMALCVRIGDRENAAFFHDLWQEEQQHGEALATWLESLHHPSAHAMTGAVV
ncbi:MAG: ferritin-like domain-containing protein [Cyanobacteriota bacterium]|nr:ferritin-like domain-containing protein [Cyanobacteriota bacterium]